MLANDLRDDQGRIFAFEINSSIGRRRLCRVIATLPGVRILRSPKRFSWLRESEFCEFELSGVRFVAEEPFGDNSRYWIGPKPPEYSRDIEVIREAFLRD